MKPLKVALSFDFEECDLPREHGVDFPLAEGMRYSVEGAERILDVLERQQVRATFFCTLNFAQQAPEIMRRIIAGGHEVAAHGIDHFQPSADDPAASKAGLERLYGVKVAGYRQPRMFPVAESALVKAGYRYNSSLNPAFIPGRYLHLATPRTIFRREGLYEVPASVTPWIRFPLFWLALHLLPEWLYRALVWRTLRHDGYFMTYFHPWEFSSLDERAAELKVPALIRANLGPRMAGRLERLIVALKSVSFVAAGPLRPVAAGPLRPADELRPVAAGPLRPADELRPVAAGPLRPVAAGPLRPADELRFVTISELLTDPS